jgi:hypothetical protein
MSVTYGMDLSRKCKVDVSLRVRSIVYKDICNQRLGHGSGQIITYFKSLNY